MHVLEHIELICRRGFYPYEWVDSHDTRKYEGLQPKAEFSSARAQAKYLFLKVVQNTDNDTLMHSMYKLASNVYISLTGRTCKAYCIIYSHCDVCLIADKLEHEGNVYNRV